VKFVLYPPLALNVNKYALTDEQLTGMDSPAKLTVG
jgi:hypothetical protein